MAKRVYLTNASLDGYIEDEHLVVLRSCGTFLYGRRLYETMSVWETNPALAKQSDLTADFASAWQAAEKIVYSTALTAVSTTTTRLERDVDPDAVQELKATATSDLTVGGANLAARAMAAGLIDECRLFVGPMIVGGGKPALPAGIRTELLDEHRFDNGVVHLATASQHDRPRDPCPRKPLGDADTAAPAGRDPAARLRSEAYVAPV